MKTFLSHAPLGESSSFPTAYDPSLLFPIPRKAVRDALGIADPMIFSGVDVWTAYELSWLTPSQKPAIAIAELSIPARSDAIVESKSLKLYFNSLNQTVFSSTEELVKTITDDISKAVGHPISVTLFSPSDFYRLSLSEFEGYCLDSEEVVVDSFTLDPSVLRTSSALVREKVYTHLFRSNCPKTGQPDWGSVFIHYHGPQIDRKSLLHYLLSYRQQNEFHEQCVERVFTDLLRRCSPVQLTVYARYLRRGGIDINPFRSNFEEPYPSRRLYRQ